LSNECRASIDVTPAMHAPVSASIYQLDGLVRRSHALQMTADEREGVVHG